MSWMTESLDPKSSARWRGGAQSWAEVAFVRVAKGLPLGELHGIEQIKDIFNNADLAAHAYVYLCRRFGPPPTGFDSYKELGCWCLTTPMAGLAVGVSPIAASVKVSLLTSGGPVDYWRPTLDVHDAVIATLRDLMRPVGIRDQWRNVAGLCEPEIRDDKLVGEVEPFKWAGYGVVPDYWVSRFGDLAAGNAPQGE